MVKRHYMMKLVIAVSRIQTTMISCRLKILIRMKVKWTDIQAM